MCSKTTSRFTWNSTTIPWLPPTFHWLPITSTSRLTTVPEVVFPLVYSNMHYRIRISTGVWPVSFRFGVWCLVSGVWCLASGVWCDHLDFRRWRWRLPKISWHRCRDHLDFPKSTCFLKTTFLQQVRRLGGSRNTYCSTSGFTTYYSNMHYLNWISLEVQPVSSGDSTWFPMTTAVVMRFPDIGFHDISRRRRLSANKSEDDRCLSEYCSTNGFASYYSNMHYLNWISLEVQPVRSWGVSMWPLGFQWPARWPLKFWNYMKWTVSCIRETAV